MVYIENNDLKNEIKEGKVLVDFYAEWCGPCKMLSPVLEKFSELRTDVKVVKVDIDSNQDLAREYGIMSVPTILLFNNGEEVSKKSGFMPLEKLEEFVNN